MRDNSESLTRISRLGRRVIAQALRDLGIGSIEEQIDVMNWIKNGNFSQICDLCGWDESWVSDLFNRVNECEGVVREPIAKQCVKMVNNLAWGRRSDK